MTLIKSAALITAMGMLAACGSSDSDDKALTTYTFPSKLVEGQSSVSYTGQQARQLLISELKTFISSDELQVNNQGTKADALANLNRIYADGVTSEAGVESLADVDIYATANATEISITVDSPLTLAQTNYSEVLATAGNKSLKEKLAGCDNNLSMTKFIGWDVANDLIECGQNALKDNADPEVLNYQDSAHTLLQTWFDEIATMATDGEAGTTYVNAQGHDLNQLVQKFLFGAVTYSQAARDYLKADKGLVKQNTTADKEGKPYTSLEHQWDEGFGYFGAATHYLSKTDAEIKASSVIDANNDGVVDLLGGEYNYGLAVYASKMDISTGSTDYSKQAMEAFIEGRELIQANIGTDPVAGEGYHVELVEISERALAAMEKVIATAAIHYINSTITDIEAYTTDISTVAKHWSEMKGFALSLQFSPVAIISETDLTDVHDLMGQSPKASLDAGVDDYITDLQAARTKLQVAYGFDAEAVKTW